MARNRFVSPIRLDRSELLRAWAKLAARHRWDCFATLTFEHSRRDPTAAIKALDYWLFRWNEAEAIRRGLLRVERQSVPNTCAVSAQGRSLRVGPWWQWRRNRRAYSTWAASVEPHRSGDLHMHALIRHSPELPGLDRILGRNLWQETTNGGLGLGLARVEHPRNQADVCFYLSKAEITGGELAFSRNF